MNKSILALILGTIFIGLAPLFVKNAELAPSLIGFYRCGIAGIILLTFLAIRNYQNGTSFIRQKKFYYMVFLVGLFFALDLFVWHRSVHLIGAGMSTILGNTQVFYLLIIGFILYKEELTMKKISIFVLAFFGVVLILRGQGQFYEENDFFWGVLFGLSTGFFYSLYTTTIKRTGLATFERKATALEIIAFSSIVTAALLYLSSLFETGYNRSFSDNWESLLGLAILCQIGGWGLISYGLKDVPLSISGLIILLQPVIAKTLSVLVFEEPYSTAEIVGATILITCIYLGTRLSRK